MLAFMSRLTLNIGSYTEIHEHMLNVVMGFAAEQNTQNICACA
jgi:hypothetical protein